MNLIFNFFKTNNCNKKLQRLPSQLADVFQKFRTLITYNILDLSMARELLAYLINRTKIDAEAESSDYDEFTNEELILSLRSELKLFYRELHNDIKKEFTLNKYYQILNLTTFLFILFASVKNPSFYEIFLDKNNKMMSELKKLMFFLKNSESQTELPKVIANMFSEIEDGRGNELGELKSNITNFNGDTKLIDLFTYNKSLFQSVIPDMDSLTLPSLNEITCSIHKKLLENIINIDFSYETIFKNSKGPSNFCLKEDKPLIKSMLCQSILRIVFSKEKYKFLNLNNDHSKDIQYEISFLKNLIEKCVKYYYEKFGDNVNCLFRREEIFDDIIKYIFFTHGNSLFYKSCFVQLKRIIDSYANGDSMTDVLYLSKDEFLIFYEDLLKKLRLHTPVILKIVLKLIYENVLQVYKDKISPDNYCPVMTIFFFNFLISPKIQEIYDTSPIKNALIKNLNRIIRNICFNEKFKEQDPMNYFNNIIDVCHLHTRTTINKIITSFFIVDDMDYILKAEIENNAKIMTIPSYLFYLDCDYIINVLEISKTYSMYDLSKEVSYIEKVMQSKRNSFYIKFNLEDFKKLKILDNAENQEVKEEEEENKGDGEF